VEVASSVTAPPVRAWEVFFFLLFFFFFFCASPTSRAFMPSSVAHATPMSAWCCASRGTGRGASAHASRVTRRSARRRCGAPPRGMRAMSDDGACGRVEAQ